jgi:hypothetical protein
VELWRARASCRTLGGGGGVTWSLTAKQSCRVTSHSWLMHRTEHDSAKRTYIQRTVLIWSAKAVLCVGRCYLCCTHFHWANQIEVEGSCYEFPARICRGSVPSSYSIWGGGGNPSVSCAETEIKTLNYSNTEHLMLCLHGARVPMSLLSGQSLYIQSTRDLTALLAHVLLFPYTSCVSAPHVPPLVMFMFHSFNLGLDVTELSPSYCGPYRLVRSWGSHIV